jgi:hypothetical protein
MWQTLKDACHVPLVNTKGLIRTKERCVKVARPANIKIKMHKPVAKVVQPANIRINQHKLIASYRHWN